MVQAKDGKTKTDYRVVRITLLSVDFNCQPTYRPPKGGGLPADQTFKINSSVDKEKKRILVDFHVDVNKALEKYPIKLSVHMLGIFEYGEAPSLPPERFANVNGPAIMFPFVRELISNLTGRTNFSSLYIPPVNLSASVEIKPPAGEAGSAKS